MSLAFTLDRFLDAPPARVWEAFTSPTSMADWFCPNPSLPVTCALDVRPGGEWSCEMGPYVVSGHYVVVSPFSNLSFTWSWSHSPDDPLTTVVVRLSPEASGTRLSLTHAETEPDVGTEGHRGGWEITLGRLASTLHSGSSTA